MAHRKHKTKPATSKKRTSVKTAVRRAEAFLKATDLRKKNKADKQEREMAILNANRKNLGLKRKPNARKRRPRKTRNMT